MTTYLSARAFERERSGSPATASPAESSSAATPWSDKYRGVSIPAPLSLPLSPPQGEGPGLWLPGYIFDTIAGHSRGP